MGTTAVKVCGACGADVSGRQRFKDAAGSYYCLDCWDGGCAVPSPQAGPVYECAGCHGTFAEHEVFQDDTGAYVCRTCSQCASSLSPAAKRFVGAGVGIAALVVIGFALFFFFSGRWERTHGDRLLALKSEADAHARAGRAHESLRAYDALLQVVGDRTLDSSVLRDELRQARVAREALAPKVRLLLEQEEAAARRRADLARAAELNAQGTAHEEGRGAKQDFRAAVDAYRAAADLKFAPALTNLGRTYDPNENLLAENPVEAARWYLRAAALGDARAMFYMGTACLEGRGVLKDAADARRWFALAAAPTRAAAEARDARAMLDLGLMLKSGWGVPANAAEGLAWVRRSAQAGNAWAMLRLGEMHWFGDGVTKSAGEATAWTRKAAEANNAHAMVQLAVILSYERRADADQEGARWVARAAGLGLPAGLFRMGVYQTIGIGAPPDPARAADCFRRAADAGHLPAILDRIMAFESGRGVAKDPAAAAEQTRKGAESGHAPLMTALANAYRTGTGVPRDERAAVEWLLKAAAAGDDSAIAVLEERFFSGSEYRFALERLLEAGRNGDPAAMLLLRRIHRDGVGVPEDRAETNKWDRSFWEQVTPPAGGNGEGTARPGFTSVRSPG